MIGSVTSLAANVAVAEPTATGRVIAAWPSFALIASYELLMRQVRRSASANVRQAAQVPEADAWVTVVAMPRRRRDGGPAGVDTRRQAWEWAVAKGDEDGSLPSGR